MEFTRLVTRGRRKVEAGSIVTTLQLWRAAPATAGGTATFGRGSTWFASERTARACRDSIGAQPFWRVVLGDLVLYSIEVDTEQAICVPFGTALHPEQAEAAMDEGGHEAERNPNVRWLVLWHGDRAGGERELWIYLGTEPIEASEMLDTVNQS